MNKEEKNLSINIANKTISIKLLNKILKNLTIKDLIKCRLISKKFKLCVDQIELNELIIRFTRHTVFFPKKWWYTNDKINENYLVKINKLKLELESIKFNLINLKRLLIFNREIKEAISIRILNLLVNLEQLEIEEITISSLDDSLLCLKKLKYLKINKIHSSSYGLTINATNLIVFHYWNLEDIKLKNTLELKYLKTQILDQNFLEYNKNIENLEIQIDMYDETCGTESLNLLLEFISNLTKFKCLNIRMEENTIYHFIFKKIICQFLNVKKIERNNLIIKINDIEIVDIHQLGGLKVSRKKIFSLN